VEGISAPLTWKHLAWPEQHLFSDILLAIYSVWGWIASTGSKKEVAMRTDDDGRFSRQTQKRQQKALRSIPTKGGF